MYITTASCRISRKSWSITKIQWRKSHGGRKFSGKDLPLENGVTFFITRPQTKIRFSEIEYIEFDEGLLLFRAEHLLPLWTLVRASNLLNISPVIQLRVAPTFSAYFIKACIEIFHKTCEGMEESIHRKTNKTEYTESVGNFILNLQTKVQNSKVNHANFL